MAKKKGGLGKGLGGGGISALIPPVKSEENGNHPEEKVDITNGETMVKISLVGPNREQPRKQFQEDSLQELAKSIEQFGLLQPLIVTKKGEYYEIIAGERRWRAARMAGLKEVPVIVRDYTDRELVEVSLIENIQRENLNPIEEAVAYQRLSEEFQMKQDEIAERVSKSRAAVTNSMRLLKLTKKVQQMLIDDMITSGHARALLAITDPEMQETAAFRVFDEKMSVRETEKLVKSMLKPPVKKVADVNEAEETVYQNLEEKLKSIVGTKVSINRRKNHRGKIEIEYYSQDELERIIDLFESMR